MMNESSLSDPKGVGRLVLRKRKAIYAKQVGYDSYRGMKFTHWEVTCNACGEQGMEQWAGRPKPSPVFGMKATAKRWFDSHTCKS